MDGNEARRVNRALNKMTQLYRALKTRKLAELGLHPGQDVLLWMLAQDQGGMTVSELAAKLGVESPTATRSLARIEKQGFFLREPVPADRRQVRIVITERARELIPRIEQVWAELAEETMGGLDQERREVVLAALEHATTQLRRRVDERAWAED